MFIATRLGKTEKYLFEDSALGVDITIHFNRHKRNWEAEVFVKNSRSFVQGSSFFDLSEAINIALKSPKNNTFMIPDNIKETMVEAVNCRFKNLYKIKPSGECDISFELWDV